MSWNPNQDPNQQSQYGGGYVPPQQPTDPYSGQGGYQQQSGYQQQQQGGYQQPGYQQPNYQQPGYQQPNYQQPGYQPPPGAGYQQSYAAPGGNSQYGASSMNIDPKLAMGLSYVGGWVTGLIFFLLEKQNRLVRFHAMQSILFFGGLTVLNIVFSVASGVGIPFIGLLSYIVGIVGFVGWIVLLVNGFQGKYFKLPVVGDYAERYANQGTTGTPGMPGM